MKNYKLIRDAYASGFSVEHNCILLYETDDYNVIVSLNDNRKTVLYEVLDSTYDRWLINPEEIPVLELLCTKRPKFKYKMPTIEDLKRLYRASLKPLEAGITFQRVKGEIKCKDK